MAVRALIDQGRLLDVLGVEVDLLCDCAERARPDARVPSCPGLTVGETARHVGSVYRMVVAWLRGGQRPAQWQRDPVSGQRLTDYLRSGYQELRDELEAREPESPAGTWWPEDRTAGFWRRRMAHETTVHRTDLQSAVGEQVATIPDDVAVDGIDEVLTLWFGYRLSVLGVSGTREGAVVVEAGDHRWIARAGTAGTEAWRAERRDTGDARISGSPMQVYLWLWGRVATAAVRTDGDEDAIAQLWALLRLATR